MLSSLTKHFNDTVFRGPDNEGGTDGGTESTTVLDTDVGTPDGGADAGDADGGETGGEPSKPLSVREQLKKSIAEANEDAANQAQTKTRKDPKPGRVPQTKEQIAPAQGEVTPPAGPAIAAPDSLSKEAKAEWDKAPKAIQEAFIKREQDSARGVQELKQRYEQIDSALAPHNDALRQMNASPGEAVNRLFLWFKALAGTPVQAFPELAKSMGYDWNKVVQAIAGGQQQAGGQQPNGQQQIPEIPAPVQQYVGRLEQEIYNLKQQFGQVDGRFNAVQQDLNAQNEAKTRENLNLWSNGKEFFEDVRQDMASLIQSGMIPLKNGQVDLDTAYERAIYYNPDVRAKVLAKQQQANENVQQQTTQAATTARAGQVAKARKASVSLSASSTPGAGNGQMPVRKPGQRLSVKDSLKEAIAQLRDQ
jgi:hypothetical protein